MAATALITSTTSKAGGEQGSLTAGLGTVYKCTILNGRFQICMHDATRCRSILALSPTLDLYGKALRMSN